MPLKASKLKFLENIEDRLDFFSKTSILRHLEEFFGHDEENRKVLELNFTPENTP